MAQSIIAQGSVYGRQGRIRHYAIYVVVRKSFMMSCKVKRMSRTGGEDGVKIQAVHLVHAIIVREELVDVHRIERPDGGRKYTDREGNAQRKVRNRVLKESDWT